MSRPLILFMLSGCTLSVEPAPSPADDAHPSRESEVLEAPDPPERWFALDASQDRPRLVSAPSPPSNPGARMPPPPLTREGSDGSRPVGEGWAAPTGDLAATVTLGPSGEPLLVLVTVGGEEIMVTPFAGYPNDNWWSPRWSPSGRYLALGEPRGSLVDVVLVDSTALKRVPVATGATGLSWAPGRDLLVVAYSPTPQDTITRPSFSVFVPRTGKTVSPLDVGPDVGHAFTGFSSDGGITFREYRLGRHGGGGAWNPVGERMAQLSDDGTLRLNQ